MKENERVKMINERKLKISPVPQKIPRKREISSQFPEFYNGFKLI